MPKFVKKIVAVAAVAALVVGTAPIGSQFFGTDSAFAKNGKGNGGGKSSGGNGKSDSAPGKSKGSGKGKGAGKGGGKSGGATAATSRGSNRGNGNGNGNGNRTTKAQQQAALSVALEEEFAPNLKRKQINAALGALNAAHASPNAFANASPNSRVGRIAAYRDAALVSEELAGILADAKEALGDVLFGNDYVTDA